MKFNNPRERTAHALCTGAVMGWIDTDSLILSEADRMNMKDMSTARRKVIFWLIMRKFPGKRTSLRVMRMRERPGQRRIFCIKFLKKSHDLAPKKKAQRVRVHRRATAARKQ
jgi:hypothetical protein